MPNEKNNKVTLTTFWEETNNSYWRSCKFVLKNLGNTILINPRIEFTISPEAIYQKNTGFDFTRNGNMIVGYLEDYLNILQPKEKIIFNIDVSFPEGTLKHLLPTNFKVNYIDAVESTIDPEPPVKDTEAPSIPEGIELIKAGTTSIEVKWSPSTDNVGVKGYTIIYNYDGVDVELFVKVNKNFVTLENLKPNTKCALQISAFDEAGNESDFSYPPFEVETKAEYLVEKQNFTSGVYFDSGVYPTFDFLEYSELTSLKSLTNGFAVGVIVKGKAKLAFASKLVIYDSIKGKRVSGLVSDGEYLIEDTKRLQEQGKEINFFIGGPIGLPIEAITDNILIIVKEYNDAIQAYNFKSIEFEGGFLANSKVLKQHIKAIKQVAEDNPGLKITYTLPVYINGLNYPGKEFIKILKENEIGPKKITQSSFNLMIVALRENNTIFDNYIGSSNSGSKQIAEIYEIEDANPFIKLCPIFGKNNNGKIYNLATHIQFLEYAKAKGYAGINGWSANKDMSAAAEIGLPNHIYGDFGRITSKFDQYQSNELKTPEVKALGGINTQYDAA
ncbi:fibronectin type III domain-containing protein [Rickettsia endosymbiont of Halotydeus destructor]|uniref:fibronectin type III domain-containing protein n=1 Tax=Rickettsia endosymbiont of Halotydeus destructor TaxID=2996754 RepID=UPI003BAE891C